VRNATNAPVHTHTHTHTRTHTLSRSGSLTVCFCLCFQTLRSEVAAKLGVKQRCVQIWFQNRRQKWKNSYRAGGQNPPTLLNEPPSLNIAAIMANLTPGINAVGEPRVAQHLLNQQTFTQRSAAWTSNPQAALPVVNMNNVCTVRDLSPSAVPCLPAAASCLGGSVPAPGASAVLPPAQDTDLHKAVSDAVATVTPPLLMLLLLLDIVQLRQSSSASSLVFCLLLS